jgi:hypothetical protein
MGGEGVTHVHTTLGSDGVRSGREKLGDTSSLESTLGCGKESIDYQHGGIIVVNVGCR